jgi:hypothetical protein
METQGVIIHITSANGVQQELLIHTRTIDTDS